MSVAALRQRLSAIVVPPRVGTGGVATGIAALDRVLSDGGLPSGRLTEIVGARGSGATTLVRQIVAGALAAGRWVAYVDGARMLAPRDWAALGGTRCLWIIRPPNVERSAWCADVLLRSGAFGLVIIDRGPPLTRPVAVRLSRLARDRDAALVVVSNESAGAIVGSAVRLRVSAGRRAPNTERKLVARLPGGEWQQRITSHELRTTPERTLRIVVEKGGTHYPVEVGCAIDVAHRLCAHPEVPDRRGVASRNRRGERAAPGTPGVRPSAVARTAVQRPASSVQREGRGAEGTDHVTRHAPRATTPTTGHHPPVTVLARKRRCAEPVVRRDRFLLAGGCRR
jgi:recombination protein RecA